jgi:integral membrane protein
VEGTFRRYRVMSFVTGTTLIVLFITLFLHTVDLTFWKHIYLFVKIVGIGHGIILYPIYMIMCFNLVMRFRLNPGLLGLMLFAGFVPGLAFYLEHRMRLRLYPRGLPAK